MSTNASSTSRSTCARAAAMTWSWTREKTSAGVHAGVDAALEPPRDAGELVLLAEPQHRQVVVGVEDAGLVVPPVAAGQHVLDALEQLVHAGPLDDGLDGHPGDEADHAELVEVLEVAGVVGQQALGDQLEQHVVVALERGEDVGVGLERGEPVDARGSPRRRTPRGTPGSCRVACQVPSDLGAGGPRLQLAPGLLVVAISASEPEKTSCSCSATTSWAKCSA